MNKKINVRKNPLSKYFAQLKNFGYEDIVFLKLSPITKNIFLEFN